MRNIAASLLILLSLNSAAADVPTNEQLLKQRIADCEHVLDMADVAITKQAETIEGFVQQNERLQKSLDYTMAELAREKAWYNDPKLLTPIAFTLGVALGVYAGRK